MIWSLVHIGYSGYHAQRPLRICKYPTHTAIQKFAIAKTSPPSSHAGGDEARHKACGQHPESGEDKHGRQWKDGEYT